MTELSSEKNNQVGARITHERRRRGWSQKELARRAGEGISQAQVSRWEAGTKVPADKLAALARALEVSADYLAGRQVVVVSLDPDRDRAFLARLRRLARLVLERRPVADVYRVEMPEAVNWADEAATFETAIQTIWNLEQPRLGVPWEAVSPALQDEFLDRLEVLVSGLAPFGRRSSAGGRERPNQ